MEQYTQNVGLITYQFLLRPHDGNQKHNKDVRTIYACLSDCEISDRIDAGMFTVLIQEKTFYGFKLVSK